MTLNAFISAYTGKPGVGDTPENTGQCVGLIEAWTDSLGLVHTWGNAKDLPADADRAVFDVVTTGIPVAGDVFCFDGTFGAGVGHTGVVVSATPTTVSLFQQNDPEGSTPHLKTYSYAHNVGWLHPKILNNQGTTPMPTSQDIIDALTAQLGYNLAFNVQPTDADLAAHQGQTVEQFLRSLLDSDQHTQYSLAHDLGVQAQTGNWQQRIADLTTQGQEQQTAIDLANKQITALKEQLTAAEAAQPPVVPQPPVSPPPAPTTPPAPSTDATPAPAWFAGFVVWLKSLVGK